ncbi:MAG: hypothetical protein N4J56_001658 [Chroococcidiopsis sp. SAG 2025]|nr:hypothetical protein [Chroococcidiopsis sp. SAG 2025]
MKAVLVATIGTRDLMFQVSSGSWCNLGHDRMKDGDEFGEQFEVLSDLGLGTPSGSFGMSVAIIFGNSCPPKRTMRTGTRTTKRVKSLTRSVSTLRS